jgi:hypothetical protein
MAALDELVSRRTQRSLLSLHFAPEADEREDAEPIIRSVRKVLSPQKWLSQPRRGFYEKTNVPPGDNSRN